MRVMRTLSWSAGLLLVAGLARGEDGRELAQVPNWVAPPFWTPAARALPAEGEVSRMGTYDPIANSWTPTTTTGAPTPRGQHTAVWTGKKMIVWGGLGGGALGTGGQYTILSLYVKN